MPSAPAILTKSASESACILCITWPRCTLTVTSLVPSSPATCLLSSPETTHPMTSRSRGVSDSYRLRNLPISDRCWRATRSRFMAS